MDGPAHGPHPRCAATPAQATTPRRRSVAGDVTVADVLKQAVYSTAALIGKWGLGEMGSEGAPTAQGSTTSTACVNQTHAHNHYPDFLWRNTEKVAAAQRRDASRRGCQGAGYATRARAVRQRPVLRGGARLVAQRSKDGPFFLELGAHRARTPTHERARALGDGQEVPDYGLYAAKELG